MSRLLYFGYGTFLDDAELLFYLPDAEKITKARAFNKKFVLCAHSGRQDRGYCHLTDKVEALGEVAHGIIVRHDPKYFIDYEGFERCFLTVYGDDGRMYDCWTLRMISPGVAMRPPNFYWNHIILGLKNSGFPEEYTEKIIELYERALPCPLEDMPDPKRAHNRQS